MRNKSVGVGVVNTNSIVKDVTKFIILVIIMSEKRFKLSDWCGEQSVSNVIDIEKQTHLTNIEVLDLLNEQQATIQSLKEDNDTLRELIKKYVFGRYVEGSLEDLKFKAIAYDDIVKVGVSHESEPKVIVTCKPGKGKNVKSFCQMFIPFAMDYEIKELEDE